MPKDYYKIMIIAFSFLSVFSIASFFLSGSLKGGLSIKGIASLIVAIICIIGLITFVVLKIVSNKNKKSE